MERDPPLSPIVTKLGQAAMAGKPTILAVTDKRSIFGILCAILIKDFDISCTDGFDLNPKSRNVSEAKCVIVDLDISRTDPLVLIEELVRVRPSLRVVGLATANSRHLAEQAKIAGARDVLDVPDELARWKPAVFFIWTAVPYRTEWRYSYLAGKLIAQDSGHVCQNLYLACEAIGVGTCAVGAYDQDEIDAFIEVDGEAEFTVYMAPVGRTG